MTDRPAGSEEEVIERLAKRLHWDLRRLGARDLVEPVWEEMDDFRKELYRSCAEGILLELDLTRAPHDN